MAVVVLVGLTIARQYPVHALAWEQLNCSDRASYFGEWLPVGIDLGVGKVVDGEFNKDNSGRCDSFRDWTGLNFSSSVNLPLVSLERLSRLSLPKNFVTSHDVVRPLCHVRLISRRGDLNVPPVLLIPQVFGHKQKRAVFLKLSKESSGDIVFGKARNPRSGFWSFTGP